VEDLGDSLLEEGSESERKKKKKKKKKKSSSSSSGDQTISDDSRNLAGTDDGPVAETDSKTITLSTYVFGLIAAGSCVVGCIASYVCTKIMDSGRNKG